MGLDLGFYNVKTKINNIAEYEENTRAEKFNEVNKCYKDFYKFEELLENNIGDDWNAIHLINTSITRNRIDGIDYSSKYDSKVIKEEDIEDIINFVNRYKGDIASAVLGMDSKVWIYYGDKEKEKLVTVHEAYPDEYWIKIKDEIVRMSNLIDFKNESFYISYWY